MENIRNKTGIFRKKKKIVRPFFFNDSDILSTMNKELPLNLQYLTNLIERVQAKYPFIPKDQSAIVCREAFIALRDLLVSGTILNFFGLFFDCKLLFWRHMNKNFPDQILSSLRVKIQLKTPPPLKKINDDS